MAKYLKADFTIFGLFCCHLKRNALNFGQGDMLGNQLLYFHFFLLLSLMFSFLLTNAFTRKMLGWHFQSKSGRWAHFEVKQCSVKSHGDECLSALCT